jgi:hypothetical protein
MLKKILKIIDSPKAIKKTPMNIAFLWRVGRIIWRMERID